MTKITEIYKEDFIKHLSEASPLRYKEMEEFNKKDWKMVVEVTQLIISEKVKVNKEYWKGEINKKFIEYLLKEGIIFENKPSRFKFLIKDDNFKFNYEVEEVIILE